MRKDPGIYSRSNSPPYCLAEWLPVNRSLFKFIVETTAPDGDIENLLDQLDQ